MIVKNGNSYLESLGKMYHAADDLSPDKEGIDVPAVMGEYYKNKPDNKISEEFGLKVKIPPDEDLIAEFSVNTAEVLKFPDLERFTGDGLVSPEEWGLMVSEAGHYRASVRPELVPEAIAIEHYEAANEFAKEFGVDDPEAIEGLVLMNVILEEEMKKVLQEMEDAAQIQEPYREDTNESDVVPKAEVPLS